MHHYEVINVDEVLAIGLLLGCRHQRFVSLFVEDKQVDLVIVS